MRTVKILVWMVISLIVVTTITLATIPYIEETESKYVKIEHLVIGTEGFIFFSDGDNCTGIIAKTSLERAESLQLGLDNKIEVRPNTHDLFSETIKHFNISLEQVVITDLRDNYYISKMILKQGNRVLELDSKPSDAMAIALRTNSSIYMNKNLYERRKENIC